MNNNNKHLIETKIINNNFEITTMSALQLITFIMEEIELINNIKGSDKKNLVISILKDFVKNNDNIFNMANNNDILININHLLESKLIGDIIDTLVSCANGLIKLNAPIKNTCCFNLSK